MNFFFGLYDAGIMAMDYSCLQEPIVTMGADVWPMRLGPDRPRLLGAGSRYDLSPDRVNPGAFPGLLVAAFRPFLVLCFGSWVALVPQEPVF
jgi:hypothetical protein